MKKIFYLFVVILMMASCKNSQPVILDVMTFNIRLDNAGDSLNSWPYRKDAAAQMIKEQNPDLIGTQEVLINQLNDLKNSLPEYNSIGVGRQDGKEKGEFSAILYKKDRFKEINSGTFWLSESPETPGSKGWDAAYERVATWAILEDISTKRQIFFINTHLDHIGTVAREESITLLLNRIKQLSNGLPVILSGDFNATPDSNVIKHVTNPANANYLAHTKDLAITKSGTDWTFHDFGRLPINEREFLDYIFVKPDTKVIKHVVIPEKLNDIFVSDHSAVIAEIEIE